MAQPLGYRTPDVARYGWITLPEVPFGKKTSSNIKASRKNNITVFF